MLAKHERKTNRKNMLPVDVVSLAGCSVASITNIPSRRRIPPSLTLCIMHDASCTRRVVFNSVAISAIAADAMEMTAPIVFAVIQKNQWML